MTKERKKLISYLIVVIMLFGTGFGLGYYLWGVDREQKPDYKKYLSKTINYIGNLEKNNQGFIKQIKGLKADIAALKKDVKDAQSRSDAQSKSLQIRIASLEEEKAQLQSLLGENQKLSKEKKELQGKIDSLFGENQKFLTEKEELQGKIDSLFGENQKFLTEKEELQGKIDSLFGENQKFLTEKEELQGKIDSLFGYNQDLVKEKGQLQTKIDQLINKPDIDVESPVSEEKIPVEEKGQLEEKGHQSENLPGSSD